MKVPLATWEVLQITKGLNAYLHEIELGGHSSAHYETVEYPQLVKRAVVVMSVGIVGYKNHTVL